MLVQFKRDYFFNGTVYNASRYGVEFPEEINGVPTVLPKDAVRLDAPVERKVKKDEPISLGEMNKKAAKPKSFVEVMEEPVND
jgi:hypothetical protein